MFGHKVSAKEALIPPVTKAYEDQFFLNLGRRHSSNSAAEFREWTKITSCTGFPRFGSDGCILTFLNTKLHRIQRQGTGDSKGVRRPRPPGPRGALRRERPLALRSSSRGPPAASCLGLVSSPGWGLWASTLPEAARHAVPGRGRPAAPRTRATRWPAPRCCPQDTHGSACSFTVQRRPGLTAYSKHEMSRKI